MDKCSSDTKWWSCSFENHFYTGCCTINACQQTPVGCPATTTKHYHLPTNKAIPDLMESESTTSTTTTTHTVRLTVGQGITKSHDVTDTPTVMVKTITAITPSSSPSATSAHTSARPSGAPVDASMPMPAIIVVVLVCVLLGALGSFMIWQGCNRRRAKMKSSSGHPSQDGGDDSAAVQEQEEHMAEHFNVPVNPEHFNAPVNPEHLSVPADPQAFPFPRAHVHRGGAKPGNRISTATSFDSTARPVSAASMRPARYTTASPTLGDMDSGHEHQDRYTNVSPTLGELDDGPSTYDRGVRASPSLSEHDGSPFGSEIDAFPAPLNAGRVLTSYTDGERNERLGSAFGSGTSPYGAVPSSWVNIWADNDNGQRMSGKKP
ncbi:hypothetical protein QBC39DRAFT_385208 [Podospora conica]|nr:hypothetical protein QBC39DRAFT_385208 [Schizothecium conicum]